MSARVLPPFSSAQLTRPPFAVPATISCVLELLYKGDAVMADGLQEEIQISYYLLVCSKSEHEVHKCNKLASRHVRVVLADPSEVSRCDICEVSPAFFYCEIDGSSLCLQCDTIVHVGGKRTHSRYLLLRQRVENNYQPDNHMDHDHSLKPMIIEKQQNHEVSPPSLVANNHDNSNTGSIMIDLNKRPSRNRGHSSNKQGC